jgi:hypothetical protein
MSETKHSFIILVLAICLCSCASILPGQKLSDSELISAARAELRYVRNGLGMYQAGDDESSYPSASQINSYNDLRDILAAYILIPEEDKAAFIFGSYARAMRDTFVLRVYARDSNKTVLTATPTIISP